MIAQSDEFDGGKRHRERMAAKSREQSSAVADVGELPKVVNKRRRNACRLDLLKFLTTYFPETTGLSPFSEDHKRVIDRIQRCILEGGLFINAVYRGFAKTTISENAAIWAALYGHRRFIPLFGAGQDNADNNIDSIKRELETNDLLLADFPEVCHPIRCLEGKPQRCHSQTYQGGLTYIEWTADKIVLPTIPKSAASGIAIRTKGITASCRGMTHKTAIGQQCRPDLVIIDDPQTDESASTELQVRKRLNTIRKSILRLGGHRTKIAVVVNATVIAQNDLVDQLLDHGKNPAWQGERIKMVRKFSEVHETLWLTQYRDLRATYDKDLPGDQERAHKEATDFYRTNREAMDAGCEVSWEHCYNEECELSAIQHAYNILIDDGEEVFASECQNEPLLPQLAGNEQLDAATIAKKANGVPRGKIPLGCDRLTCFIDVQKSLLYWQVFAWGEGFSGACIDYGTWPDQRTNYYSLATAKQTIQKAYPKMGLEAQIFKGLGDLCDFLLDRDWHREDNASMRIKRLLIDANWGESTDTIYDFCKRTKHAALVTPSHGMGVRATSTPFAEYKRKKGDQIGHNWRMPNIMGKRVVRYVVFDSNYWKSFSQSRLAIAVGDPGCVSLFQPKSEGTHQLLADHLTAEYGVSVAAKGRSVVEWALRPDRPDNHFLDCFVGNCVAASMEGVRLPEGTGEGRTRKAIVRKGPRRATYL